VADPYVGEIRMFGGNFAPAGWAFCNGALLPISEYETLFNLIGTTYGGDGQNTFALPNLQGRVPVHQGSNFTLGMLAGAETVTLNTNQMPLHSHAFEASTNPGAQTNPAGNALATIAAGSAYVESAATAALASGSITPSAGGNQPHTNMQPFLCVSFIISLFGIYPSPN
jgi:microcystin-dependent protein